VIQIITDITGTIKNGMWNYGDPFPEFNLTPVKQPDWVPYKVVADIFEGFHSQTGTFFETPGHFPSSEVIYNVDDIPFEKLIDIPVHVLHLRQSYPPRQRSPITADHMSVAINNHSHEIPPGEAVLVDAGWGTFWDEPFYLNGPYFTYDAFMLLLDLKPRLMGADLARWENLTDLQGFFPKFYAQDIWMLAPVVNLECIESSGLLSVLPLNISNSCCVPCRAFIRS